MKMELNEIVEKWLKDTSKRLDISEFELNEWPEILKDKESKIVELNCSFNGLTSLPLFPNLIYLSCRYNALVSLPLLPNLTKLWCSDNELVSLPLRLPKLTELGCHDNQLTSLPLFPNLTKLWCYNNPLFSTNLTKWKKVWRLKALRSNEIRSRGLKKVIKVLKNRLYLPRLESLKQELVYSPNHPGKFYKNLRVGNWSFENNKPKKLTNLNK